MGNVVILQVKDAIGVYRNAEFWSSDGTTTGNLIPVSIISDNAGNVMLPASQTDIMNLGNVLAQNLQNVEISSGNISIFNWPTLQHVIGNVNVTSGSMTITNFPAIQQVLGNVNVSTGSVTISNLPANQNVTVTAPISISNFPNIQPISGNVTITNFSTRQSIVGLTPFETITTIVRPNSHITYSAGQLINNANVGMTTLPILSTGLGANVTTIINSVTVLSNGNVVVPANFAIHIFPNNAPTGLNLNDANVFTPDTSALTVPGVGLIGSVNNKFSNIGMTNYLIGPNNYAYYLANLETHAQTDIAGNLYAAVILENSYNAVAGEIITVKISGKY